MTELIQSLKTTFNYRRLAFWVYGVYFVVSSILGIAFYYTVQKELGKSVELKKLLNGFDRTVIGDMMNSNKQWSDGIMSTLFICTVVYLLISILINAGLIVSLHKRETGIFSLIKSGMKHYLPFSGFAIFFYLLLFLIAIIFYFSYTALLGNPVDDYHTEKPFVYSLIGVIFLFFIKASYLWIWSMYSRFNYLTGMGFWKSIYEGLRTLYKKLFAATVLLVIVWIVFIILMAVMNNLHHINAGNSWIGMIAVFLCMQVTVVFRYFVKIFAIECARSMNELGI